MAFDRSTCVQWLKRAAVTAQAVLALIALPGNAPGGTVEKIAAIVNDEVISYYDLEQRIKLVVSSSGLQPNEEVLKRIEPQVLRSLIEEHLQLQEADRQKIKIDEREVDMALANIARSNNMSAKDITTFLAKTNVDVATLKDQIRADLAWNRLIGQRFGSRIYISDDDINAEFDRLNESLAQPQYLVAEIVLRIDSPDQDEEVHKTADRLLEQLRQGAPFQAVARQFSQSPDAANGGDLGWIQRGQLGPEIEKVLTSLSPGQVSTPIRTPGGYHILFLRNKREAGQMQTVVEEAQELAATAPAPVIKRIELKQLLLSVPKNADAEAVKKAGEQIMAARARLQGCGNAASVAAQDPAIKVTNLPMMAFEKIAPAIRQAVAGLEDGQASEPIRSTIGLHVLIVCRRELGEAPPQAAAPPRPTPPKVAATLPDREEVEGRLYNHQLSMMSRRYLRDLRRDAVIEYR